MVRHAIRRTTAVSVTVTAALVSLTLLVFSCAEQEPSPQREVEFVLGTASAVTIYGDADPELFQEVFGRLREIEQKMSVSTDDYDDTELLEVNRQAGVRPVQVSEDTFEVVSAALDYSRLTEGAFEVTIGPVVSLWGIGTSTERIPLPGEIERALELVGFDEVVLDPETRSIYLPREGMKLDVGGIAKGYAADEAARILEEAGVEHAILDFGGNIMLIGGRPGGGDWRIGVQNPVSNRGSFIGILGVQDRTIVTSGNYERYFITANGTRYHHIIDHEDGYPTRNGLTSVSILADESMAADALSTAVYVMGLERGMELVNSLEGVDAAFVTEDMVVHMTGGFRENFQLTDEAFTLADES